MATTVPAGQLVLLPEGGEVEIVRQLCGSITVRTELGSLLRLDAAEADAVGFEPTVAGGGARWVMPASAGSASRRASRRSGPGSPTRDLDTFVQRLNLAASLTSPSAPDSRKAEGRR